MIELEESVTLRRRTKCTEITDAGVMGLTHGGDEELFRADAVVVAIGMKSRSAVVDGLVGLTPEFVIVGDCARPGKVFQAVRSGYDAAMNIG
jgi:NADPH-dependent 2,4-dienoyl-CoA reductase/sulfur reductase-like enzyme